MDRPFPPPAKGEPLTAAYLAQLVDAIRASRIEAGPGLRAVRTPAGTTLSLAPTEPSGKAPSLFDVKFKKSGNATHAFVYIGFWAFVFFDEESITPYQTPTESNGWIDVGVWTSSNNTIYVTLVASAADVRDYGDAVWRIAGKWCISVGGAVPTGYTASTEYSRIIFALGDDGPHKLCGSPIQFSSRACDAERVGTTGTNKRSIAKQRYDTPVLQVYGFDNPTTASNPWASDAPPTGVTNNDWLLMIRRKLANGDYEIQYMPLAQVAGSPEGNGQPKDSGIGEAPDDEGIYGRSGGDWEDLSGHFWPQGGDESKCYGSAIGDESGTSVITLGGPTSGNYPSLDGPVWGCEGAFNCAGSVNAVVGFFTGSGSHTVEITPGIISSTDNVYTDVVVCNRIVINGNNYQPKQITFMGPDGRPHTETVLAQVSL